MHQIPNILAIAGSDPSGGAGIQADIKAISANGGYAMAAITALTVQNTRGVHDAQVIDPAFVCAQIAAIRDDIRIDAVKIGMLGSAALVTAVAGALTGLDAPIILDPVMVAKGGDRLLARDAITALSQRLIPLATVITPNLPEAAALLNVTEAVTRHDMSEQAAALLAMGPQAVLLKGGHLPGETCPDLLVTPGQSIWIEGTRFATRNTHGTGCTLASALATRLAITGDLETAARQAQAYIRGAIGAANGLSVGEGHGPTDHFFALRQG